MKVRQIMGELAFGIDARLKLATIVLQLRALGYATTGDVVADVKAALADRFTEYDRGLQEGIEMGRTLDRS